MTARELLTKQLADAESQLFQAIQGLDAEHAETRACAGGLTIREQIHHVAEAAYAMLESYEGREHQFGTWNPADRSWQGIKDAWKTLRAEAVAKLPEDDVAMEAAAQYLVGHDYYHVGAIVTARLAIQPEWDAYVIYRPAF